jgi:hypothetical protein
MSCSDFESLYLRINKHYPPATGGNVTVEGQVYHSIRNNPRSRRQISRSAEVTHILSSLLKKERQDYYLSKSKRTVLFSVSRLPDN